uniref:Uncharacterized protein n=1 Tax=Knipowitschia caucasica TaxID=637954 RepID=A0AAV2JQD1_KNICA
MVAAPLQHHMFGAARHGRCVSTAAPLLRTRCRSSPRGRCARGQAPRTLPLPCRERDFCLPAVVCCLCPPVSLPPLTSGSVGVSAGSSEPQTQSQPLSEPLDLFSEADPSAQSNTNGVHSDDEGDLFAGVPAKQVPGEPEDLKRIPGASTLLRGEEFPGFYLSNLV